MEVDSGMGPESEQEQTQNVQENAESSNPQQGESNPYGEEQAMAVQQQNQQQNHHQQGSVINGGPRPAPTYKVVSAIMEKEDDGPGPRCGHTLTAVAAVGDEGQPGYIGPRLILFGGATALEGNSAAVGPPSSGGNAGISMFL